MEQMNFHKQKLYALIAGAVGVISCFLPWWSFNISFLGQRFGGGSVNGMHDLGIIAFLGFAGGVVLCFLEDKTKPFEGQLKLIAAACFGGAALLTLIQFLRASSNTSFGLWLSFVCGVAGAVIVWVLKPEQLENKSADAMNKTGTTTTITTTPSDTTVRP
jgi:peptidoglycan/LPS O-acetylase OafA/YrhL